MQLLFSSYLCLALILQGHMQISSSPQGRSYLLPFALITSLFFLWGFAHSILDVLNKYFQNDMALSKTQSAYIQMVVYGGYFLMALPAGVVIDRWGYRTGVLVGLLLYGLGALLFIPGGQLMSFPFFLGSLFIIGCGLTFLETSANPYVTVLGDERGAARRINFSQSFNGLGWMLGPLVGGWLLFSESETPNITLPYAIIGSAVLLIALIFARIPLPEIEPAPESTDDLIEVEKATTEIPLWRHKSFLFGLLALFLYVAAQTGVNSFFINYAHEAVGLSDKQASTILAFGCMGLFMLGRMGGSWLMARIPGEHLLTLCSVGATVGTSLVVLFPGNMGFYALFVVYLCESIMFPTIFALALRGLGKHTKMASSLLIMSIVGGAIAPILMGLIADSHSMALGFVIPLFCFLVITAYGAYVAQHNP